MKASRIAVLVLTVASVALLAGCGKKSTAADCLKANIQAALDLNKEAHLQTISQRCRSAIADDINSGGALWQRNAERFTRDASGPLTIVSEQQQGKQATVRARIGNWDILAVLVNEDGWKVDSITSL